MLFPLACVQTKTSEKRRGEKILTNVSSHGHSPTFTFGFNTNKETSFDSFGSIIRSTTWFNVQVLANYFLIDFNRKKSITLE